MVNCNGALLDKDSNFLNHTNRAFRYGDALFEDVRVVNGRPVFWEEHYFRLMSSMRILRMEIPMQFTMEYLESELLRTIEANDLVQKPALLSFGVFRDPEMDITPNSNEVSYVMSVSELASPFYIMDETPYEVELFRDYFVNPDMLSRLDTNNKTLEVVASIFAQENGSAACIVLNTEKRLVGTALGSLFLVKGGQVKTPPLSDGAKNNVLRKKLMAIIHSLESYEMEEASITPFELQKADELFVLNTSIGIRPITKYRKKVYTKEVAKDLLGKLNAKARLASLK